MQVTTPAEKELSDVTAWPARFKKNGSTGTGPASLERSGGSGWLEGLNGEKMDLSP